jgi:adenylate cyclase
MGLQSAGNANDRDAWLETADGRPWPLGVSCSIGRSPSNTIILDDPRISRRHAVVHRQDSTEYWLVDLGSGNGSFLNGLRIANPTRLNDGDCVGIGESILTFRQALGPGSRAPSSAYSSMTMIEVKSARCWMLVADIVGSTKLASSYEPARWASLVGTWTDGCRRIVEGNGGLINKYLGDGFLAIWPRDGQPTKPVKEALDALFSLQRGARLPFRIAVHFGDVVMGGGRSLGEDNISGAELVLLFRMEKIAGSINRTFLCSEPAAGKLQSMIDLEFAGEHAITGFTDSLPRRFFGLRLR